MTMYATIPLTSEDKAKGYLQEAIILRFFKEHPGSFTPYEVWKYTMLQAPLTSVRRCITDLTERGFLEKTDEMRQGQYGKMNYCWRLAERKKQQGRLF